MTIGAPPPPYPGGQVASGQRLGLLGNRTVFETPFAVQSLTRELIENTQVSRVAEVATFNPSVRINNPIGGTEVLNLTIRGFALGNSSFQFDGFPGVAPARAGTLEGIERIELILGPSGLLTGVPRFGEPGGSLNLVPMRATDSPITRTTAFFLSEGTIGGRVDVGRRYGPNNEWGVRTNLAYSNGRGLTESSHNEFAAITFGTDYRGERFRWSGDFVHNRQRSDGMQRPLILGAVTDVPTAPPTRNGISQPWLYFNSDYYLLATRAEYDVSDGVTVGAGIARGWTHYTYFDAVPTLLDGTGRTRAQTNYVPAYDETTAADLSLRARFATGPVRHQLAAIIGAQLNEFGQTTTPVGPPVFSNIYSTVTAPPRSAAGLTDNPPRTSDAELYSFALADTISILDERVQFTAGLRFQNIQIANYSPTTGARLDRYDENAITPAFALLLRPTQQLSFYANYIEALTQGPTAPVTAVNAGQVFRPFLARQYEVGAKYDFGRFGTTLAYFNITREAGALDPVTRIFALSGEQRNQGVEFNVFGEPIPGVRLLGGATWIDAELTQTAGGQQNGNRAPGVPRFVFNTTAEVDVPGVPGLTGLARAIYNSGSYVDTANRQWIGDAVRFDLGARYRFTVERTPLTARFNVINVADARSWQTRSGGGFIFQEQPRTYLLSLSADF
ncbi:TonB-dependent siderophore receptor [Leptolyngbya sp. 15MV]|nr:TonB-dependent siderophore receptor [Leptolyngbya sp. 15MV]